MKKKILLIGVIAASLAGGIIIAADHIDAPSVTGTGNVSLGTDITDLYAFQSPTNNSNMVFALNTQGLLSPSASGTASFPSNVMYEINIDNTGDNIEDLVIQALFQNGKMRVYGPVAPTVKGTTSTVLTSGPVTEVAVTAYGSGINTGSNSNGIKVFAGPRDDPFFFDLARFKEIIAGTQPGGFRTTGVDFFAGTNVMSIVVEVPKTLLGSAATINVWAETKSK